MSQATIDDINRKVERLADISTKLLADMNRKSSSTSHPSSSSMHTQHKSSMYGGAPMSSEDKASNLAKGRATAQFTRELATMLEKKYSIDRKVAKKAAKKIMLQIQKEHPGVSKSEDMFKKAATKLAQSNPTQIFNYAQKVVEVEAMITKEYKSKLKAAIKAIPDTQSGGYGEWDSDEDDMYRDDMYQDDMYQDDDDDEDEGENYEDEDYQYGGHHDDYYHSDYDRTSLPTPVDKKLKMFMKK